MCFKELLDIMGNIWCGIYIKLLLCILIHNEAEVYKRIIRKTKRDNLVFILHFHGFEVVQNDEHIVKVKGEHNGDVLYATLNRDTNEYTMETLEKPKGFFAAMTATKSVYTEYSVNVGIIDGDVVDAVIVNKVTGEELSLEQNTDKVVQSRHM